MSDLSVIIPSRGQPLGLWASLHSCEEDLTGTGLSYEYVVVTNGEPLSQEVKQCLDNLKHYGLLKHLHCETALSPGAARQRGVQASDGKYLFFFDNHCLVGRHYFKRALQTMQKTGADILHSAVRFYAGAEVKYHYKLRLKYDFWASYAPCPDDVLNPYQIAAAGHGGFVVRRDAWDDIGGYGPEELYAGYGGEEISFNLTAWRYGKTSWIDPRLVHYHYAGVRGYDRHFTDEYYVNMMVSAFVTGGEAWLYRLFDSFLSNTHVRKTRRNMYDLLEIAYRRGAKYAVEVDSKSKKSLDELLVWFKNNQVAM